MHAYYFFCQAGTEKEEEHQANRLFGFVLFLFFFLTGQKRAADIVRDRVV